MGRCNVILFLLSSFMALCIYFTISLIYHAKILSQSGEFPTDNNRNQRHQPAYDTDPLLENKSSTFNNHPMDILRGLYELAVSDPLRLVKALESDPLGTNVSEPTVFLCPPITHRMPSHPNLTNSNMFRNMADGYYVFFQHLRKAGGTSFCDLARANMIYKSTPPYYCMIDDKGSLATPPWDSPEYLRNKILQFSYRIVANEWDVFYRSFLTYEGAVFATTIRHPLDRWYSQYRFEHLEHRDGSDIKAKRATFIKWYKDYAPWTMGANYYLKTFHGEVGDEKFLSTVNKKDFYWTYRKYDKVNKSLPQWLWKDMQQAIGTISQFNLILVLEWIQDSSSKKLIENALGWKNPIKQVLPHEVQAIRAVKKSLTVKDTIDKADYEYIFRENALDIVFYEATKRIYLERLNCGD